MEDIEIEKMEDEIQERTGFIISIDELGKKGQEKFGNGYDIRMWFNDMFAWALSYCMDFIPEKNDTVENIISEFNAWFDKEGSGFKKRFDDVPYPDDEHIEEYFRSNRIIAKDLEKSINAYCKKEICTDMQEWE